MAIDIIRLSPITCLSISFNNEIDLDVNGVSNLDTSVKFIKRQITSNKKHNRNVSHRLNHQYSKECNEWMG